jgi:hypothetical protein
MFWVTPLAAVIPEKPGFMMGSQRVCITKIMQAFREAGRIFPGDRALYLSLLAAGYLP